MHRLLLLLMLTAMPLFSHAIEEPEYEVIRQFDNVELRQYAPYVVAEVVLDATAEDAGNRAFPILAGYIFGKNKGERKFAMTAPVTQSAAPAKMECVFRKCVTDRFGIVTAEFGNVTGDFGIVTDGIFVTA